MELPLGLTKDEITTSVRTFKIRRDNLLHDDITTFDHNFDRFLEFCRSDRLVRQVLDPIESTSTVSVDEWWENATQRPPTIAFPSDANEELSLRYRLLQAVEADSNKSFQLGIAHEADRLEGWVNVFRNLVLRPFAEELSHRLGDAANLATPEARAIQAVPLTRIPAAREVKIFLSHKSVDKPMVRRYFDALTTLGFDPWLDEQSMPAGANLEREVFRGFEESCAAVFFITESFKDEKYLAAEVDYAVRQKRIKDRKFAIITLRDTNAAAVPGLLTPYVYRDISNDLEGLNELLKALPIELGPVRWKMDVI